MGYHGKTGIGMNSVERSCVRFTHHQVTNFVIATLLTSPLGTNETANKNSYVKWTKEGKNEKKKKKKEKKKETRNQRKKEKWATERKQQKQDTKKQRANERTNKKAKKWKKKKKDEFEGRRKESGAKSMELPIDYFT